MRIPPELAFALISALTDTVIAVAAKYEGISDEAMRKKIDALQPKADVLEKWLKS